MIDFELKGQNTHERFDRSGQCFALSGRFCEGGRLPRAALCDSAASLCRGLRMCKPVELAKPTTPFYATVLCHYAERHTIDVGKAEGARGRRCRARIDTLFGDSDVVVRSGNVVTPSLAKKPSATLEQMRRSNGFARRRRPFFGRLLSFRSQIGINFRFYLNYFTGPPKRERSAIF